VAARVEVYGLASVPAGSCAVVIFNVDVTAFTVSMAAVLVALPAELLTVTVNSSPLSEVAVAA